MIASGVAARDALAQLSDEQWRERPPNMSWTRLVTALHSSQAAAAYAVNLSLGDDKSNPMLPVDEDAVEPSKVPSLVYSQSLLLATVARGVPAERRGWHGAGLPDAEGFLAMGCTEVLLHCWDALAGTEVAFAGDDDIADHVLQRLFPWQPKETPRWQTLLFATGRGELEGFESPGERWLWHNAPLDEWDGEERTSDRWVGRT